MHPLESTPKNTPLEEDACNSLHPRKIARYFPITQKNALKSVQRAKAALVEAEALEGRVGADVARVAVERAQAHLRATLKRLRPLRQTAHLDNVWGVSLEPTWRHTAVAPLPDLPEDVLRLFPRIEPVWLTPAEERSAARMSPTEE